MSIKSIVNEFEFHDDIDKKKLYIDYMQHKSLDYLKYIYLQSVNVDPHELVYENNSEINIEKETKFNLIKLINKNRKKDIENKLNVLTEGYLILLRVLIEHNGYLELTEKGIGNTIDLISVLRNIGFIFVGSNDEKLVIHMPQDVFEQIYDIYSTDKIKSYSKLIEKNTNLYKMIEGIVVAYGTINYDEVFDMIFEKYPDTSIDRMYSILFFGSYILNRAYYMEENVVSYAKEIIDMYFDDDDKDLKKFSTQELISLADHSYYMNMNEYSNLKELLREYISDTNVLIAIEEKLINIYLFAEQVSPESGNMYLEMNIEKVIGKKVQDLSAIQYLLYEISRKMPKWSYNGFSAVEMEKMSNDMHVNKNRVYELKIKINDIKPSIIRKIQIPSGMSLNQLAAIIILLYDWSGYSEYAFKVGRTIYYKDICKDDNLFGFTVDDAFENSKKIKFLYNLNDKNHKYFIHDIELINIYNTDIELKCPKCVGAKNKLEVLDCNKMINDKILIEQLSMLDTVFLIETREKEINDLSNKNDKKIEISNLLDRINNKIIHYKECSDWLLTTMQDKLSNVSLKEVEQKYTEYLNNFIDEKKR